MSSSEQGRSKKDPPCRRLHDDDGIDPRVFFRPEQGPRGNDRKTHQLCAQVARTLRLALPGDCRDPALAEIEVLAVEPAPDASRLRVVVRGAGCVGSDLVRALPLLRSLVAEATNRRRVPELVFEVRP